MENSMSKVISSNEVIMSEESGWTVYFDDYFNQNNVNENASSFSSGLESCFISDAASSVAKKAPAADHHHDDQVMGPSSFGKRCDRLSFKKRKTKLVDRLDNDLEDTATSPVNSPKICNLINQLDRKPEQKDILMDISQEKGTSASAETDERIIGLPGSTTGTGRDDDNNNNDSELKKRGLCLVPLSLAAKYLG